MNEQRKQKISAELTDALAGIAALPITPAKPDDFWQRCIRLGVGVVPFRAYLDYDAWGNYDETTYAGIRYVCLLLDTGVAVLNARQFVIGVDFSVHDLRWVAETPEGALDVYERRLAESRGNAEGLKK